MASSGLRVRLLLLVGLMLAVSACSDRSRMIDEAIELGVIDERHTDYWLLNRYRHGVICGKWDSSGEGVPYREGFKYFIIKDGAANKRPHKGYWQVFCTDDPAAGLAKIFGIGPLESEADKAVVLEIHADLTAIVSALKQYQRDYKDYPYTHQGLKVLLASKDDDGRQLAGYLQALPNDPWGRPYRYEFSELGGGVAIRYKLYTLGADNEVGGKGQNTDISSDHLEFLEYVLFP